LKIKRKESKTQKECNKEHARTITKKKTQWPPERSKKHKQTKERDDLPLVSVASLPNIDDEMIMVCVAKS